MSTRPVGMRIVAVHTLPPALGSPEQLDDVRFGPSGSALPVALPAARGGPDVSPRCGPTLGVVTDALRSSTLAEPLLTADQVSQLLGIPRSSVYEYARRSRDPLPAVRVGRHVRFQRAAVERWLAGAGTPR